MQEVKFELLVGKTVKYIGGLNIGNKKGYMVFSQRKLYLDVRINKKKKVKEEFEQISLYNGNWYSLKDFIILD